MTAALGTTRTFHRSAAGVAAALFLIVLLYPALLSADPESRPAAERTSRRAAPPAASAAGEADKPVPAPPTAPPPIRGKLEDEAIRRRPAVTQRPAAAPKTAPAPSQGLEFARIATALGIVIGLILVMRWLAKRFFVTPGRNGASRVVQVLSRTPLAPKQQLLMIQVGRRIVVAADSGGQMNSLCEITDPDEVASLVGQMLEERGAGSPKSFGSLFSKMRRGFDDEPAPEEPAFTGRGDREAGGAEADEAEDPALSSTRSELRGLMDKVRLLSRQFKAP